MHVITQAFTNRKQAIATSQGTISVETISMAWTPLSAVTLHMQSRQADIPSSSSDFRESQRDVVILFSEGQREGQRDVFILHKEVPSSSSKKATQEMSPNFQRKLHKRSIFILFREGHRESLVITGNFSSCQLLRLSEIISRKSSFRQLLGHSQQSCSVYSDSQIGTF